MINQEKSKGNIDKWVETVRKKHVIKRYQPSNAPVAPIPSAP